MEETVKIRYPVPGEFVDHIVDASSLCAVRQYFLDMYDVNPIMILPDGTHIIVHLPPSPTATFLALRYPLTRKRTAY